MRSILLTGTALSLSRIAFGTASVHHLLRRRERARLLHAALDAGITHFDTSPYYGDGVGEMALSALPASVTIATKVGLYPRGGAHGVACLTAARRLAGRLAGALTRPVVDFSISRAARSLEASLRRLRRERVELLLLHEPRVELLATDEWRRWFERERPRVGAFGIAGEAAGLLPVMHALAADIRVIQTRDSLAGDEAAQLRRAGYAPQITYGHLARRDPNESVPSLMGRVAARFPDTVLLVSTRRMTRVAELAFAGDVA